MDKQQENYRLLIDKLDKFIRKFYINSLIRGSLYFVAAILIVFLSFSLLEDQYYFDKWIRKIFFYGFIAFFISTFIYWIGIPLLKYFRLGKTISHEQAAVIIGQHFANIEDKLLNILHLQKQVGNSEARQLILAGIEQKSQTVNPLPFRKAIDLSKNKKYLRYALPPFLIFLILLFAAPSLIKDSTTRIIQNDKAFEKEAPFSFVIENDKLEAIQYQDLKLNIRIEGDKIPDQAFILINQYQYRLKKEASDHFSYTFKNLYENTSFELSSGKVNSRQYEINVLPKPSLENLSIQLDYPNYTGRKNENVNNNGDLVVPAGTKANWEIETGNTDQLNFYFDEEKLRIEANQSKKGFFSLKKTMKKEGFYRIYFGNKKLGKPDSISYTVNIIPDKYPEIDVQQFQDSIENQFLLFVGEASDDYGIRALNFHYSISGVEGQKRMERNLAVDYVKQGTNAASYEYALSLDTLDLAPGESLQYYFEVFDNDAINGSKSSRTGTMILKKATREEFEEKEDQNEEEIKEDLKKSMEEIRKLKEKLDKNRDKILQKKELEWQDKKELEKILEQQKELEKMVQEAKQKFEENLKNQEQFNKQEENILQKQEQLQKMFDEVLNEETKELMEKIDELMQELQKDQMLEMMEEFKMDNETMEKELDRLMELFKQLELEKELTEQIDKLRELAEEQEKLSEETKEESKEMEELQEEQEKINEAFEKLEENMEEILEKNEELERPKPLDEDNMEQMDDISNELDESEEQLEKSDSQNAAKSQKSASQKMKSMANSLENQLQAGQQEQHEEDLQALRQLLENLLTLSFEQEDLIDDIKETDPLTPRYKELVTEQFALKEDFKMIEDSLQALSKRVIEIESFVTEKVGEIKQDMAKAIKNLEGLETNNSLEKLILQNVGEAGKNQRSTMKNINDLALMLDESMQQMQQNMAQAIPGAGTCSKPGGKGNSSKGNVPKDKISEGQDGLNKQLQDMKDAMQKGGSKGTAKEFAQAAARQAAMRKALEQMKNELNEQGKGAGNELQKIIDEMNKTEIDLVNKKLDNDLLKRQQNIMSRLLEAEKAERQRKFDNQRKSTTANQREKKIPPALEKYLKERESEIDLYKTVSPSLNPFYKKLVDDYYKALKMKN